MEFEKAVKYLTSRGIDRQYIKAKQRLLSGDTKSVNFKLRYPKGAGIYQFRNNQKYRAYAQFNGSNLEVFRIDDHQ